MKTQQDLHILYSYDRHFTSLKDYDKLTIHIRVINFDIVVQNYAVDGNWIMITLDWIHSFRANPVADSANL